MNVKSVGIVGMGLLGRGISACLVARGFHVVVHSIGESWQEQTQRDIAAAVEDLIAHGCAEPQLRSQWRDRYQETESVAGLTRCEFLIESVSEDLSTKRNV